MTSKKSLGVAAWLALVMSLALTIMAPATPAKADPGCAQGGVYLLWARGSGQPFNDAEASAFDTHLRYALAAHGITDVAWAELGDLDGNHRVDTEKKEYPAVVVDNWRDPAIINGKYNDSVTVGVNELVTTLNHRYGTGTGSWVSGCNREITILGGYSQGADLIGRALLRPDLSQAARDHIGFIALYGDPHNDCNNPVTARGVRCPPEIIGATLGSRSVPAEFEQRTRSWCDIGDGVCTGRILVYYGVGNHGEIYQDYWIWQSASDIADSVQVLTPNTPSTPPGSVYPSELSRGARQGSLVQSDDGNLYVYAGGRLFWFDRNDAAKLDAFEAQATRLTGTDTYIPLSHTAVHAIEVNRDNNGNYVPGSHMPADNTFLYQYGNPTQYVIKFQHPFAVGNTDEVTALGGADRAIMVPTSISDLQQYPAQWVQNDLLQFYGGPAVWHFAGDRGYRVPSVPTRDCLSVRWHRGVTLMPSSAWNYFPTNPTQQAACDFTHGQVLVGQPSQRQVIVLYNAGFAIGSPQEAVAIGAANRAEPVADETVDGLLARTPSIPQGHVFRAGLDTKAYQYVDGKMHYIGSPATRDCLLATNQLGTSEEVVPNALIAKYPVGSDAYCQLEGRQILAPNGVNVVFIKDGYRRPVMNPAIRDCLAVRAGAGQPLQVSDNVWNSYTSGANAYCPYEQEPGLNFVKDAAYPDIVWLVGPATGSTPGVKRHAGALCVPDPYTTQIKAAHVFTVPAHETDGHVQGPDWWPSSADCQALPH